MFPYSGPVIFLHIIAKLTEVVVFLPRIKKKKKTPEELLRIYPVCFDLLLQEMPVK